jgi:hypothetical protein
LKRFLFLWMEGVSKVVACPVRRTNACESGNYQPSLELAFRIAAVFVKCVIEPKP